MANLGSLWYNLHIHDLTAEDLQAIEKKLKNLGIELDTKKLTESLKKSVESYKGKDLTLGVKAQFLHDAIRSALKQQEFPIKVTVNKAEAQEAVREALLRAGLQRSFKVDDKRFYDAETRRMAAMQVATAKAGAQNALAQQRLARAHRNAEAAARSHTSACINLGSAMRGNIRIAGELGPMIASAYSVVALKNFMTKVVEIGGELEQQKLAMKAILGDEGLANTITSQINSLAIKSPFGVMELNKYAKQLTAFQIPYNELYDTMKRMADISAATSVDMGRIILAYGQIKAATVLKGTEARQLTEANIPIYEMLSKYYTELEGKMVSVGEVMDRMSKKQIPFQDVKNVLWELTDAGGKFYNMQEVLSESVKAKWKNLADALDLMFADIAQSSSKPLMGTAELLTELTTRWKTIGAAVVGAAATYGVYRVAVFAANRVIAANNAALFLNSIAVGANVTKWQFLKAKVVESISSIGASVRRFATSMRGMFVGIGVVVEAAIMLWQRHNEQMQKAEEIGKQIFTKATEGAKNLSETVKGIQPPKGLTDLELTQGIEQMETAIKDYSATPIDDINDSLVAQDGHLLTLAERYEVLKEKVDAILASYNKINETNGNEGYDKIIAPSISVTNGLFRDGLFGNAEDYADALKETEDFINKNLRSNREKIQKFINWAKRISPEFEKAISGLNLDAAYKELAMNRDKYEDIYNNKKGAYYIHNFTDDFSSDKEAFEKDVKDFVEELRQRIRTEWKANPDDLNDEQKDSLVLMLDAMINNAEGASDRVKQEWRSILKKSFSISFDASVDVTPLLNKELSVNFKNYLGKDIADKIKSGLEISPGDKEFEPVKNAVKDAMVAIYAGADNATKQALDEAVSDENIDKTTGLVLHSLYSKNAKPNTLDNTSQKDALAEALKQRFKDIKDAWSEFQKWSKTEGRDAAAIRIGESGLFSTLSADKIPQTVEQYRALVVELESELRKAGVKGTARESLLNDLLKQLLDIDKTVVDEQLKLALDKVTKEAERQLADWNLFDKIRKATGNQDLAMSVAFGMNADATTDYPALVKKQFSDLAKAAKGIDITFDNTTLKEAQDLGDEIAKSYQDTANKLEKYAREQKDDIADILNEYQSLQDKLTKIDADRNRKIKTVQVSDMSAPDKAKYIQRINVEADYQKFTQSADYLKFFSGIYSLTMDKAQEIGDKIRLHLDERLQAGKISAEDYYKEIGRINQQLAKLRNVKSDALTFISGGIEGLQNKKLEIADSKVLEQTTKVQRAEEELEKARKSGNKIQIEAAEFTLKCAKNELSAREKVRDAIIKDMQAWQEIADVVNLVSGVANGLSSAFDNIRDMADSFGFDTESAAWLNVGGIIDTFKSVTDGISTVVQSAMKGDVGGIIGGAVATLTTPFTIWPKLHDKKLQKLIDRSKEAAQILQNQYDIIEKRMSNFLGNAANMKVAQAESDMAKLEELRAKRAKYEARAASTTGVWRRISENRVNATEKEIVKFEAREKAYKEGGAYGYQRQLMTEQLAELEKQRQAEIDKKKTDNSVVEDYNKQIEEMKIAIQDFAIEAAKAVYGIDLNGWAEQIGNALVGAFAKGEDAAVAFDKTVGDIMRSVVSKMISQDILAPMFGDLRNFLFGKDGVSGAFGADFKLDASEVSAMKEYLDKIKNDGIPAAEDLFDAINDATGGLLDETDKAKSGVRAGIQSVTESTADLLASYTNGIRGDVSVQTNVLWPRLLDEVFPQMNVIAESQLQVQRQIAENTLRSAKAAEAIVKSNDEISKLLNRVTMGGAKFYIH